jgi:hypothetical protein
MRLSDVANASPSARREMVLGEARDGGHTEHLVRGRRHVSPEQAALWLDQFGIDLPDTPDAPGLPSIDERKPQNRDV